MKYFIQIDANEQSESINWLISEPLLFTVLFVCARRARKSEEPHPTLGLLQWEFLISQTETKVFGLKKSQHGILYRAINRLVDLGFIQKTGKQTGNEKSTIYLYNKDNPITFGLQTGNEIDNEQVAHRYRVGNEQVESYKEEKEVKEPKEEKSNDTFLINFEEFYKLFPNKKARPNALKAYKKVLKEHEAIMKGLQLEIEYRKWAEEETKKGNKVFVPFWKHPATWLNQRSWEDEFTGAFQKQRDRIAANEAARKLEKEGEERKKLDNLFIVTKTGFFNKKYGVDAWTYYAFLNKKQGIKILDENDNNEFLEYFKKLYPKEYLLLEKLNEGERR